ncbi:OmpP1/FadL family transporter [Polyangium mundeleinium]|uniref:Outer membrane protein transport protein n=1 Tax=Polyangium mundeleinium TaxID=2995306 RepID=A0ABT5EH16_9BACT|nr:outer membrane protein transport protein [Polyangium mundeleinium]MDC0741124.1 outer membrane protein transport protein [Polyangium mundeleinium]
MTRNTSPRKRALALGALAAVSLGLFSESAGAAGLYLSERGVRPLGRGGAFVAGADDLGSVVYNPAGLYDAGMSVLFDASYVHFSSEYTRRTIVRQTDPNTGATVNERVQTFDPVRGSAPFLPIPTLGFSFVPHDQWVVGVGLWAPYVGVATYPETLNGQPAPQRYSLLSLEGSILAVGGAYAAYAPTPNLRIGAGVEVLAGTFRSTVVFSGCVPDRFFCAPEQPSWDVLAELAVGPIVAPSANAGVIYIPHPKVRVGLSGHLPFWVRSSGTIRTRLPSAAPFATARQEGEDADVAFELPWNVRLGVEARPSDKLRAELAVAYEDWGVHDSIRVNPNGVALKNVVGFPETYLLPPVNLPRNFRGAFSAQVGGEYAIPVGKMQLDVRAGLRFETSAVPNEYVSVLTIDSNKLTPSVGAGLHVGPFRFDLVVAHAIMFSQDVDPREAKIPQVSPLVANPAPQPNIINGGTYSASATIVGLGAMYTFGKAAPAKPKPEPAGSGT